MNVLGGLAIGLSLYGFAYYNNNKFSITRLNARFEINNRIRILQLSDLHGKSFGRNNKKLIEIILKEKPDIVVATGDLIDSNLKNMDGIIEFLSTVNSKIPLVYIAGNNENRSGKLDEIVFKLRRNGVMVLINEIVTLYIKNNKVNILGLLEEIEEDNESIIERASCTYYYNGVDSLLKRLERLEGIKVVLSHYPENFEAIKERSYSKHKFNIMFSGHAHGGQFILPWVGGIFAPGQGLFPKYYAGMYGRRNKLVVSRGLGNSGFPLRLFNRPDIVIVDIK